MGNGRPACWQDVARPRGPRRAARARAGQGQAGRETGAGLAGERLRQAEHRPGA